jgi:hypothetical protein
MNRAETALDCAAQRTTAECRLSRGLYRKGPGIGGYSMIATDGTFCECMEWWAVQDRVPNGQ